MPSSAAAEPEPGGYRAAYLRRVAKSDREVASQPPPPPPRATPHKQRETQQPAQGRGRSRRRQPDQTAAAVSATTALVLPLDTKRSAVAARAAASPAPFGDQVDRQIDALPTMIRARTRRKANASVHMRQTAQPVSLVRPSATLTGPADSQAPRQTAPQCLPHTRTRTRTRTRTHTHTRRWTRNRANSHSWQRTDEASAPTVTFCRVLDRTPVLDQCGARSHVYPSKLSAVDKCISAIGTVRGPAQRSARTIFLSHNCLRSLDGLQQFAALRTLSLADNVIEDLRELRPLRELHELRALNVDGNPIASTPHYRAHVIAHLHPDAAKPAQSTDAARGDGPAQYFKLDGVRVCTAEYERAAAASKRDVGMRRLLVANDCVMHQLHVCVLLLRVHAELRAVTRPRPAPAAARSFDIARLLDLWRYEDNVGPHSDERRHILRRAHHAASRFFATLACAKAHPWPPHVGSADKDAEIVLAQRAMRTEGIWDASCAEVVAVQQSAITRLHGQCEQLVADSSHRTGASRTHHQHRWRSWRGARKPMMTPLRLGKPRAGNDSDSDSPGEGQRSNGRDAGMPGDGEAPRQCGERGGTTKQGSCTPGGSGRQQTASMSELHDIEQQASSSHALQRAAIVADYQQALKEHVGADSVCESPKQHSDRSTTTQHDEDDEEQQLLAERAQLLDALQQPAIDPRATAERHVRWKDEGDGRIEAPSPQHPQCAAQSTPQTECFSPSRLPPQQHAPDSPAVVSQAQQQDGYVGVDESVPDAVAMMDARLERVKRDIRRAARQLYGCEISETLLLRFASRRPQSVNDLTALLHRMMPGSVVEADVKLIMDSFSGSMHGGECDLLHRFASACLAPPIGWDSNNDDFVVPIEPEESVGEVELNRSETTSTARRANRKARGALRASRKQKARAKTQKLKARATGKQQSRSGQVEARLQDSSTRQSRKVTQTQSASSARPMEYSEVTSVVVQSAKNTTHAADALPAEPEVVDTQQRKSLDIPFMQPLAASDASLHQQDLPRSTHLSEETDERVQQLSQPIVRVMAISRVEAEASQQPKQPRQQEAIAHPNALLTDVEDALFCAPKESRVFVRLGFHTREQWRDAVTKLTTQCTLRRERERMGDCVARWQHYSRRNVFARRARRVRDQGLLQRRWIAWRHWCSVERVSRNGVRLRSVELVRRCIKDWHVAVAERTSNSDAIYAADQLREKLWLRRIIRAWRTQARASTLSPARKHELHAWALAHDEWRLKAIVFRKLVHNVHAVARPRHRAIMAMCVRMESQSTTKMLCICVLRSWRATTVDARLERRRHAEAVARRKRVLQASANACRAQRHRFLTLRCFLSWRSNVEHIVRVREAALLAWRRATGASQRSTRRRVWLAWVSFVSTRRSARAHAVLAFTHYFGTLARRFFNRWRLVRRLRKLQRLRRQRDVLVAAVRQWKSARENARNAIQMSLARARVVRDEAFGAWQRHTYMSIRRRQCFALVHRRILRASVRIAIGVWRRYASLRASGEAAERARLHAQEVEELQQDAARGRALASRCESLAVDEAALRRRLCVAQSALAEVKQGMMSASKAEAAEERRAAKAEEVCRKQETEFRAERQKWIAEVTAARAQAESTKQVAERASRRLSELARTSKMQRDRLAKELRQAQEGLASAQANATQARDRVSLLDQRLADQEAAHEAQMIAAKQQSQAAIEQQSIAAQMAGAAHAAALEQLKLDKLEGEKRLAEWRERAARAERGQRQSEASVVQLRASLSTLETEIEERKSWACEVSAMLAEKDAALTASRAEARQAARCADGATSAVPPLAASSADGADGAHTEARAAELLSQLRVVPHTTEAPLLGHARMTMDASAQRCSAPKSMHMHNMHNVEAAMPSDVDAQMDVLEQRLRHRLSHSVDVDCILRPNTSINVECGSCDSFVRLATARENAL